MSCPARLYWFFVDARGVRWGVETRLVGEGADAIPVSFTFTSERGEHRALVGSPVAGLSCDQFSDGDWCELLTASRVLHPAPRRSVRHFHTLGRASGRS